MGYYIQSDMQTLITKHQAMVVTQDEARQMMDDPEIGIVVVMNNGMFCAYGYAFCMAEFEAFTLPNDNRPKKFLAMSDKDARTLLGYKASE